MSYSYQQPDQDLLLESQNFWAGQPGGRETPPPPSYQTVDGVMKLGRMLDPFGCQVKMRAAKNLWQKWMMSFFIVAGSCLLLVEIDPFILFVMLPLAFVPYLIIRNKRRAEYDRYYGILHEILDAHRPLWVAYTDHELKTIERIPLAVFP